MNSLCVDIGSMWLEQWSPSGDRLACLSRAAVLCTERLQTIRIWEVLFTVAGHRDRIVERSQICLGLWKDGFSDVACRRGISNLAIFCVAQWPLSR